MKHHPILIRCAIFLLALVLPVTAQAQVSKEYLVKAAFIYNFVKFVEWPSQSAKPAVVNICIIGSNPFGTAFKDASTASLTLNVIEEKSAKSVMTHPCQVTFISQSEEGRLPEILGSLKTSPVLTISDMEQFASKGGMIGFVTSEGKIRLVVNTKASTGVGLRISAQLLEIALSVIDK